MGGVVGLTGRAGAAAFDCAVHGGRWRRAVGGFIVVVVRAEGEEAHWRGGTVGGVVGGEGRGGVGVEGLVVVVGVFFGIGAGD